MPLTRYDLDEMAMGKCWCCDEPFSKENPLEFAQRCHPHKPVKVAYWEGILTIHCAECEKIIVEIRV